MSLITERTHWVFLCASADESEERHIYDIAFGVFCLESRGIKSEDITIIIDGSDKATIEFIIQSATDYPYTIRTSYDLFSVFSKNTYDNIVLFVTGHGSVEGIAANSFIIKPYPLFNAMKSAPGLKKGIVYLGQCYAGVFNYMQVKEVLDDDVLISPPLIILGATNLFQSISHSTEEQFKTDKKPWNANLFLLSLFQWIKNPIDIDGDGKFTVMDSFKYSGALANDIYKQIKSDEFLKPFEYINELNELKMKIDNYPEEDSDGFDLLILKITFLAKKNEYENSLNIRFNHQESWILNSIPAQEIEF